MLYKLCDESCFIKYHKVHNKPVPTCCACSSICTGQRLLLPTDDGTKNICSEECLVKSKEVKSSFYSSHKHSRFNEAETGTLLWFIYQTDSAFRKFSDLFINFKFTCFWLF